MHPPTVVRGTFGTNVSALWRRHWGYGKLSDSRSPGKTATVTLDIRDPFTGGVIIVLIAAAAVYLISNHWLHILDALPYLGVVLMLGMHLFMHGGHGVQGHAPEIRPAGPRGGAGDVQ